MDDACTVTALTPIRKVIAARMSEAVRTIPHFRMVADLEIDALLALRGELRRRDAGAGLSLNDFIIKACANALRDTPDINIQWAGDAIRHYRRADVSVVIAVNGGLSTPIIRSADEKSIWEISREVKDLSARAAGNALRMDEIAGGTFSISNLGMFGVEQFDAIINAPQCAILAVGAAMPRVSVTKQGESRIVNSMRMTLSLDHRAIDGTVGAAFLSSLRNWLVQPEKLLPSKE